MDSRVWNSIASRRRVAAGLACLCIALAVGPALGQTRGTWNVDADGLWSLNTNWLNNTIAGGVSGTANFTNNITATRTVTLDSNRSLGSFVFGDADTSSAASWIVTSSTMTMDNRTNSATITVNALGTGATATISTQLAASGTTPSIIKDGVGTLVLSATNTFTTKLAITSGTLQVSTDRNLGAIGNFAADRITISNGATLRTSSTMTLSGSRGLTIGSGGGTISANGGAFTIPAPIAGSGNTATVTGASAVTLQNTSGTPTDVNWDFASNNGIRIFFEGTNALGTGTVTVRNGVRLTSQNMTTGTITNSVTLASGAGLTARLTGGAQTYSNVSFPASGSVVFNRDDQATAGLTILSGAALTGVLTVDTSQFGSNAVGDVTLSGTFSGAGGLTKSGTQASGKLILAGGNTYTGTTSINTGTLALGAAGSIANSAAIVVASNAAFDVSAVSGYTLGAAQTLRGGGTVVGAMTASGTISPGLSGTIGTLSFANNVSMGAGTIMDYQLNGADTTVGGVANDLSQVTGNLILDGSLNVAEFVANSFQSATVGNSWRLFNYTGTLTDNGLTLGTMPALSSGLEFNVDTNTANQVNLVVVAAVPEPATVVLALMGIALAGANLTRRRSRLGS